MSSRRSKRQPETLFNFHYEQLEVEAVDSVELNLEKLNHETFYIRNGSLDLHLGTLNVQQLELLEAPKLELVPVHGAESYKILKMATDLDSIFINEMEWDKLLQDLVWRHQPLKLSQLHVEGVSGSFGRVFNC